MKERGGLQCDDAVDLILPDPGDERLPRGQGRLPVLGVGGQAQVGVAAQAGQLAGLQTGPQVVAGEGGAAQRRAGWGGG